MACHFGGDQVENSLRASLIRAVKGLRIQAKRNKSKGYKKPELIVAALSFPFLSSCLCRKVHERRSMAGLTPRSVGIGR